jgi:CheY-like chemotaxis protein
MNLHPFPPAGFVTYPAHLFRSAVPATPAEGHFNKLKSIRIAHPGMEKTIILLAALAKKKEIRIILADDDQDDRELFAEAVEQHMQVHFQSATDGMELMEMLNNTKDLPDIIFLDLNMPGKTGKECLEEIRRNSRLSKIQVVIYSTSLNRKDIDDTFSMGANLYIRKPNTFKELTEVIRKVFAIDWDDHKPKMHKQRFIFSNKSK